MYPQFYKDLTTKTTFFEGWPCFKFNNFELALSTNLKFYTSLSNVLKLKVTKVWGLIFTFIEVTREKLVEGAPICPPPSILNRVKSKLLVSLSIKTCRLDVLLFSEFINIVPIFIILLYWLNYVIVYFFGDLFRLVQRINYLPNFI